MQSSVTGARSPGITYQQLLDTDTKPVPEVLRLESPRYLGDDDVSIDRYVSREWHEREKDRLWSRVWQFACREDDVAEPGAYTVYEIAGRSYLIVRDARGALQAYPNACLHRGRQLKDTDGRCDELRCPFHGFAWTLDGHLLDVPARWDFEHVQDSAFELPRCRVDVWAGFVFINPDPDAPPLADHLGELVDQFAVWDLGQRCTQLHVSRIVPCNWKIAQEAFCEAFHVNGTHPQVMAYLGDTNSQIDVWDTFARVVTPGGTPSPLLEWSPTEDEMMRAMLAVREGQLNPLPVPDGQTMRAVAAQASRDRWRASAGDWVDRLSDAEMMDSIDYTLFPNFHPWGAFNRIVYRFRPNGDDHRTSIMEVFFLAPFLGDKPRPAPVIHLGLDDPFTSVPQLGMLAKVFEQDVFNMGRVQTGLESTRKPGVTLGTYQESKVRWLNTLLTEWVES
jgi:phenylpropionate dioxygenase-like ring-hydroxylating dioxygenase large terminal subunit